MGSIGRAVGRTANLIDEFVQKRCAETLARFHRETPFAIYLEKPERDVEVLFRTILTGGVCVALTILLQPSDVGNG